jgi:lipoprotein NlpD
VVRTWGGMMVAVACVAACAGPVGVRHRVARGPTAGTRRAPPAGVLAARARADRPAPAELPAGPSPFLWPVPRGVLSSDFGRRGASHHDGIDISSPEGTPVLAARAGRVLYSDRLRGYGNLIVLEHEQGYATVYAHNRENRVRAGAFVRQGEVIASVGRSGRTTGPNLHFEIRRDNVARNPLFYLSARAVRNGPVRRADVVERGHDDERRPWALGAAERHP